MRQFCRFGMYQSLVRRNCTLTTTTAPKLSKLRVIVNRQAENEVDPEISLGASKFDKDGFSINTEISRDSKDNIACLPPTLQHVRELMDHYENHVILTQMGSFYELYFEHAIKYAPQLNISLTSKSYSCGRIPFAGFPVHQLSRHLKVLVNTYGHSVTIVEQFKKNSIADNDSTRFFRRVTRIVTPGTFIDEAFENLQENTYLLNIEFPENCINKLPDSRMKLGLCWCDVSTGEIFVQQVTLGDLVSAVTRIQPKEILLDDSLSCHKIESGKWYPELVELKKYFLKYQKIPSRHRTIDSFFTLFSSGNNNRGLNQLKIRLQNFTQKELAALRKTLVYVSLHLPDFSINFQLPERQVTDNIMQIDSRTCATLELHASTRDQRTKGTLLSSIRRTVTATGTRLLAQWLSGPSLDLQTIRKRQRLVSFFKENIAITEQLQTMLRPIHDLPRILQRFNFGRGEALQLVQIAKSLKAAREIKIYLQESLKFSEKSINDTIDCSFSDLGFDLGLINDILKYLNEDELINTQKNADETSDDAQKKFDNKQLDEIMNFTSWVVHPSYSEQLLSMHQQYESLHLRKEEMQKQYKNIFVGELGAKNVLLKQRQNGEYALHIQGNPASFERINEYLKNEKTFAGHQFHNLQQATQSRWISHKSWSECGFELEISLLRIKKEEAKILNFFQDLFLQKSQDIRKIADFISYIDVLTSFAALANEKNLIRPTVDKSDVIEIVGGRHITVEDGIVGRSLERFTENDCKIKHGNAWVITGPNMGGKSTFLRQNAINVILAQMGCFIPCKSARIGLVDKIFSRVGSADDLYNEKSTFMVEMIETSFILHGATEKSLAILDEVGRGTSGKEGVGIAFATLKHLVEKNNCRSLFATHFGQELQQIINRDFGKNIRENVKFYKSNIIESSASDFCYDYRLKPGICSKSDAIKVAQTAGFPEEALKVAQQVIS